MEYPGIIGVEHGVPGQAMKEVSLAGYEGGVPGRLFFKDVTRAGYSLKIVTRAD